MQRNSDSSTMLQNVLSLFESLQYTLLDGSVEEAGGVAGASVISVSDLSGRRRDSDVVLLPRLRAALKRFNPDCDDSLLEKAVEELTSNRSTRGLAQANQEVYRLLKQGVKVDVTTGAIVDPAESRLKDTHKTLRVINWNEPEQNDFVIISNFWVNTRLGPRRLDLVGFVNGLPLMLFSLQEGGEIQELFNRIEQDFKPNIPALFWYNATIVLSSSRFSGKLGSMTTPWEHFFTWKRIKDENEPENPTLETLVNGVFEKTRFIDILENFILFDRRRGGLTKLIARNHQYLGVNRAIEALRTKGPGRGKLGVFWHTQGSGKSYSMIFFVEKALRKISGSYRFVVVTDRDDLDKQIYENFYGVGAIIELEKDVRANDGDHLKKLLGEDHRVLFTLIQKFRTKKPGMNYGEIADSDKIIVITDEAHRSQYDTLAKNMRTALPNASFIGFTGTPLMEEGEEETKETFGNYVSIYNFRRAINDGITVPLFYENHTPELELENDAFNDEMARMLEEARLNEEQELKVEEQYAREGHFLVNDERLEWIARDIVGHFMGRGYPGKAMVVSIDKLATVRMYTKVGRYWKQYEAALREQLLEATELEQKLVLEEKLTYMAQTEMAVVVSDNGAADLQKFAEFEAKTGEVLDIAYHHRRFREEKLEEKFKSPKAPLRIVFVCAMWMTGFDVPCLSTMYLDRPLRNHTLMQAIARANRVFEDKANGLIVDYIGSIRELEKALLTYAREDIESLQASESPVGDKSKLIQLLRESLTDIESFCQGQGIDIPSLLILLSQADRQGQLELVKPVVNRMLLNDELKVRYLVLAGDVRRFYKAILPDPLAGEFTPAVNLYRLVENGLYVTMRVTGVAQVLESVTELVNDSLTTTDLAVRQSSETYEIAGSFDIGRIDLATLEASLRTGYRNIKAEKLRGLLSDKLKRMIKGNKSRIDYLQKLERVVNRYNDGSANQVSDPPLISGERNVTPYPVPREAEDRVLDEYNKGLVEVVEDIKMEEQRAKKEGLSEEELAIFDIVMRDISLSAEDREKTKAVVRELDERLRTKKVVDWRVKPRTRSRVEVTIQNVFEALPKAFEKPIYDQKCLEVFIHVQEGAQGDGSSSIA